VTAMQSRLYNGVDPLRASAYPTMIDPFHWYGVVETPAFFAFAPVNSLEPEVDPEDQMEIRFKPEETPVTLAAKKSYLGRVFLDWAQYPIAEIETSDDPQDSYIVRFQDLRYIQLPDLMGRRRRRGTLGAAVKLDKNLHVLGDVYAQGEEQVLVPDPGGK